MCRSGGLVGSPWVAVSGQVQSLAERLTTAAGVVVWEVHGVVHHDDARRCVHDGRHGAVRPARRVTVAGRLQAGRPRLTERLHPATGAGEVEAAELGGGRRTTHRGRLGRRLGLMLDVRRRGAGRFQVSE